MSWFLTDVIPAGKFILATQLTGYRLDPFGVITVNDLEQRVREIAQGWALSSIDLDFGVFGIGAHTYIFGRAQTDIPAATVNSQLKAAFDSFLLLGGSDFRIQVSDNLSEPVPNQNNEWAGTLQLVAIAVIAVAVVYGVRQLKEISE